MITRTIQAQTTILHSKYSWYDYYGVDNNYGVSDDYGAYILNRTKSNMVPKFNQI